MNSNILEKVLAYVDAHIYEKINLCDLSDIAGYSPFYFSKLFSEMMGMPVTGYIRIRKLQYAAVSLLEGNKVLDVALLYAFDSHEGFTRAFTQLFGSTPSIVKKHLTSYTIPAYVVPTINNRRINMETVNMNDLQNNMHQLIFEFIKQSIEEAKNGYCDKIEVTLLPDSKVKISDNGRGLPLSEDLQASKAVLNKILSGRPITNLEYSQMGDLVQAGLQTVNSLCEALQVTVNREGRQYKQDYIRGIAQHDLIKDYSSGISGTQIILKPDTSIFGETVFSEEMINNWLKEKTKDIVSLNVNICSTKE